MEKDGNVLLSFVIRDLTLRAHLLLRRAYVVASAHLREACEVVSSAGSVPKFDKNFFYYVLSVVHSGGAQARAKEQSTLDLRKSIARTIEKLGEGCSSMYLTGVDETQLTDMRTAAGINKQDPDPKVRLCAQTVHQIKIGAGLSYVYSRLAEQMHTAFANNIHVHFQRRLRHHFRLASPGIEHMELDTAVNQVYNLQEGETWSGDKYKLPDIHLPEGGKSVAYQLKVEPARFIGVMVAMCKYQQSINCTAQQERSRGNPDWVSDRYGKRFKVKSWATFPQCQSFIPGYIPVDIQAAQWIAKQLQLKAGGTTTVTQLRKLARGHRDPDSTKHTRVPNSQKDPIKMELWAKLFPRLLKLKFSLKCPRFDFMLTDGHGVSLVFTNAMEDHPEPALVALPSSSSSSSFSPATTTDKSRVPQSTSPAVAAPHAYHARHLDDNDDLVSPTDPKGKGKAKCEPVQQHARPDEPRSTLISSAPDAASSSPPPPPLSTSALPCSSASSSSFVTPPAGPRPAAPPPARRPPPLRNIGGLTVEQLKVELQKRGLPALGKKQELVDRLKQHRLPTPEQLVGRTVVGVDPGKVTILSMTSDDDKTPRMKKKGGCRMEVSVFRYLQDAGITDINRHHDKDRLEYPDLYRLMSKLGQASTIKDAYDGIEDGHDGDDRPDDPVAPYRPGKYAASFEDYRRHVAEAARHEAVLVEHFSNPDFLKWRFQRVRASRRFVDRLANDIKGRFGHDCVLAVGAWIASGGSQNLGGSAPTPRIGLLRQLEDRGIEFHVVDEFRTTMTCSKCGHEAARFERCATFWNRDYNAAMNIRANFLHMVHHSGKPDPRFSRASATPAAPAPAPGARKRHHECTSL
eukprot:TRINITY_DN2162_c4_g1_i4.p1 TRINITY_DN2162_c4_g1~~TRINITY_DN2162_c4_g1_i4.p1  ORF type:complete len:856 (-),score=204.71 TRINITY_DN2162_c4_g1_i4:108-2675(-)